MTTFFRKDVVCSSCGAQSSQSVLGSTNRLGYPDLDMRPPIMERSTMHVWLQECASCGLVAADLGDGSIDDQEALKSPEYLLARNDDSLPRLARRFMCRAIIATVRREPQDAFQQTLHAAWVADDAGRFELARACRLKAAAYMEGLPGLDPSQKVQLLDVLRRACAWSPAETLAAGLAADRLDDPLGGIVAFQAKLIGRHDEGRYTVSDAIPPPPESSRPELPAPPTSIMAHLRRWMGW